MPKIWEKVRRGGFLFSLVIGLLTFSLINITDINTADAAVAKMFYYQGTLKSGSSYVADGNVTMQFYIYDAVTSGNCVWASGTGTCTPSSSNNRTVAVKNGVFSASIGGTGENSLSGINLATGLYYLQVRIDYSGTFQDLSPRKPISAFAQAINTNSLIGDGHINITGTPTGSGVGQGTVYINPSTASANDTILGIAVAGNLAAKIDAEGDMELASALASGGLNVDGGALYTDFSNNSLTESAYATGWVQRNVPAGEYYAVAMSANGKYQTVGDESSYMQVSNDYGVTWTQITSVNAGARGIAVSYDGKYQTAACSYDYIYISSDYGVTWTQKGSDQAWQSVAMSADGKIQTAVIQSAGIGYIYNSTDYGNTWTQNTSAPSGVNWWEVDMSDDGKYQTAVISNGYMYVSTDYGVTWTQKESSRNWFSVAISGDGKYQTAVVYSGYIYKSTNYGSTWSEDTSLGTGKAWNGVAMSSDGKIQTIVAAYAAGYIWNSTDYGANWTQKTSGTARDYLDIDMSFDGRIQTAVSTNSDYIWGSNPFSFVGINTTTPGQALTVAGSITSALKAGYLSTDNVLLSSLEGGLYFGGTGVTENQWENTGFAQNWTARATDVTRGWFAVAMSSDGKIQTAGTGSSGKIFNSTDYGVTWTQNASAPTAFWYKIAMSSDGKIQTAPVRGGYIYNSYDYGVTWAQNTSAPSATYYGSALSSDGKIQATTAYGGYIWGSTDYGVTWTQRTSDTVRNWKNIAISSDGKIQTAIAYGGYIYSSTDYGFTWVQKTSDSVRNWNNIAMSSDGKYQTAGIYTSAGYLYVSSDYGNTWSSKASSYNWTGIAMSGNGKIQTAGTEGAGMYSSVDYGNTWNKVHPDTNTWTSIAMSSDGKIQTANLNSYYIYTSYADSYIFGKIGVGASSPTLDLTVDGNIGGVSSPVLASVSRTTTTISDADSVGDYTSVAIGVDGLPIIAYRNTTDTDIMILKCGNSTCSSENIISQIFSDDSLLMPSIVIGSDGLPIVSYQNYTDSDLIVTHCGNNSCSSGNVTTVIDGPGGDNVGWTSSITIGTDGMPLITHVNKTDTYGDLMITKCSTLDCSTNSSYQILSSGDRGEWSSVAIGTDGLPIFSDFLDDTTNNLYITKCGSIDCTTGNIETAITDPDGDSIGEYSSIAIGSDGLPIVSYYNATDLDMVVMHCGNIACSSGNTFNSFSDAGSNDIGINTSIVIGRDGFPIISYRNQTDTDLQVTKCGDLFCTTANATTYQFAEGNAYGRFSSIEINSNGLPIISHYNETSYDLSITACADSSCSQSSATVLTGGSSIGASAVPYQTIYGLQFSNPTAFSNLTFLTNGVERLSITPQGYVGIGDSTPTSPLSVNVTSQDGASADFLGSVGIGTTAPSFELQVNGNIGSESSPTLSSVSRTTNQITSLSHIGEYTSIAIGVDGLPIISHYKYIDGTHGDLMITHCGDSICSSSADNITTLIEDSEHNSGTWTSIAIGTDGLPIISYKNETDEEPMVTKCGNIYCSSGNVTTQITNAHNDNISNGTSIVIGADGFPLVSYKNYTDDVLVVTKCSNISCTASTSQEISSSYDIGTYPSIKIGIDGLPIISHLDYMLNDLVVTHCGNSDCSSGNITTRIQDNDDSGYLTSMAIGSDGLPIISHYNFMGQDLMVTHCSDVTCVNNTTQRVVSTDDHGYYSSIAIGSDGLPIISFTDWTNYNIGITHCGDLTCSSGNTTTSISDSDDVGFFTSLAIGANGLPIISYHNDQTGDTDLMITSCADVTCSQSSANAISNGANIGSNNVPYQIINALQISNPTAFTNLSFTSNGAERLSITPGGFVGIGISDPTSPLSVNFTNNGGVSGSFLGSVGIATTNPTFKLQVDGNIGASSSPLLSSVNRTTTRISEYDAVGWYPSIAIGADNLPIISYVNLDDGDLMITKCGNATCSYNNTTTQIYDSDFVGYYSSLVFGTDGYPIISYYNTTDEDLMITHCTNASCTTYDTAVQVTDGTDDIGMYSSIAIGSDNYPVISSFNDTDNNVEVTKCGNTSCSSSSNVSITTAANDGYYTSIKVIGGYPIISYYDTDADDLTVTRCSSASCSTVTGTYYYNDGTSDNAGQYSSLAVGSDGYAVISHYNDTDDDLLVTKCSNTNCSSAATVTIAHADSVGLYSSIIIGTDGYPVISHFNTTDDDLMVTKCADASCTPGTATTTQHTGGDDFGAFPSIAIGSDTYPVIVSADYSDNVMLFTKCSNTSCSTYSGVWTIGQDSAVGLYTSITVGSDGLPIISYFDGSKGDLWVTKCGDFQCTSGNITTNISPSSDDLGWYTSIAIGTDGLPVISYTNNSNDSGYDNLMITKCSNLACSDVANNITTTISTSGLADGSNNSLAIGADGFPIVSYRDSDNGNLNIVHCNNISCSSYDTPVAITNANNVGYTTSIAIGTDKFPIISYYDTTADDLVITHCTAIDCSTYDSATYLTDATHEAGYYSSIAIGSDGLPIISYENNTDGDLMITKCGNVSCSTSTTQQIADTDTVGEYTSLAIGTDGLPVISHYNSTDADAAVTKCNNLDCSSSVTTSFPDMFSVGYYTSVAIGTNGFPIVSYEDTSTGDLVVTACADSSCSATSGTGLSGGASIGGAAVPYQNINALAFSNPNAFTNLTFSTNGVDRLTITPNGLIGLGTSTPKEALEVVGNIAISKSTSSASESWTATDTSTVTAKYGHTTIWTGSKMIVFGGITTGGTYTNTGYIYDPVANTWSAISTGTNCPTVRAYHTAVWTGSKMIIWGGYNNGTFLSTGSVYDPVTNTWTAVSSTSAPSARQSFTAVWTGSKMIVWGGETSSSVYTNTGGMYDPVSNTWVATSTGTNCPTLRDFQSAIWTGSRMIIWGGFGSGSYLQDGGIFDPVANAWATMSTTNAPSIRSVAVAVWTGSKMIVWGGYNGTSALNTGGLYDIASNSWTATSTGANVPVARIRGYSVWTGSKLIVWGGKDGTTYYNDGAIYDPMTQSWTTMAATSLGSRNYNSAVWTGSKLIIWGGWDSTNYYNDGAIYVPVSTNYGGNLFVEGDGLINGELHTVGPITSGGFYSLSGADLAETYLSKDNLEPGTLITPDILNSGAVSISRGSPYDNTVIGVVSTLPGMTLGYGSSPTSEYPYSLPIALAGRVPVRVSSENGPINIGDPITSSSIPGVAMKAVNEGNILGTALESFDPLTQGEQCELGPEYTCSKILTFISMSYIRPAEEETTLTTLASKITELLEQQEQELTSLETIQSGLDSKLTNITFSDNTTNISGTLETENLNVNLDLTVLGNLIANGGITVNGNTTFEGNVVFNGETVFEGNTMFEKNTTVGSNTAGTVIVPKGSKEITIVFDKEYASEPIIFADISISNEISDEDKIIVSEALAENQLKYIIKSQSVKGFAIELTKDAPVDITFIWKAIQVK